MTKFKQIVGRGTRIAEDYGNLYFTIMDFKKATELFADPDFDGDPVQIYEPKGDDPIVPPDEEGTASTEEEPNAQDAQAGEAVSVDDGPATIINRNPGGQRRVKYVVNDVPFLVIVIEHVET